MNYRGPYAVKLSLMIAMLTDLFSVLEHINNRMNQWSQIGRIQAFREYI